MNWNFPDCQRTNGDLYMVMSVAVVDVVEAWLAGRHTRGGHPDTLLASLARPTPVVLSRLARQTVQMFRRARAELDHRV